MNRVLPQASKFDLFIQKQIAMLKRIELMTRYMIGNTRRIVYEL